MTLRLAELSVDNLPAAVGIELKPGQERYVAPVKDSIAEAYVNPTAWPRLIVDDNEVVGFVMGNFDADHELEAFRAGIWRLNVAASAQGRGVGRFAVEQIAAEARNRGFDRITVLWEQGDDGPEKFYLSVGFEPTGEILLGEVVGARAV
jgi:diamine N-acetyltransferase